MKGVFSISIKRIILSTIFFVICLGKIFTQEKKIAYALNIYDEDICIDGFINESFWNNQNWQSNFVQRQPYDGKLPSEPTGFKLLYNNKSIFIAIRAWDSSPDSIVDRLARRDEGDGDYVGIELDTYFDKKTAFSFLIYASGVRTDKLLTEDGNAEDYSWDAIWNAKTSKDSLGWIAEIEIPLNQLRFNIQNNNRWGLLVGRYIYRKQELSLWQQIPRDASGWVNQFGYLDGIDDIKPKLQIEVAPYIVTKAEYSEPKKENPFEKGKYYGISGGLDTKIGITNDFTLDLTLFPDFGQVELDPSEINLTAFETYFSEKRPFFVEGRNLSSLTFAPFDDASVSENLFYSRRIGKKPTCYFDSINNIHNRIPDYTDIIYANKISGKNKNGLSIGILQAITSKEYAESYNGYDFAKTEIEPLTNYFVGSISKEFSDGNTQIGLITTSTNRQFNNELQNYLHKNALSCGVDLSHFWNNKNYYFRFKYLYSHVNGNKNAILLTQQSPVHYFQRPDATHISVDSNRTSLSGSGGGIYYGKVGGGHWRYNGFITWKSPELEINDIGYIRNVDDIFQYLNISYNYWKPAYFYKEFSFNLSQWTCYNYAGELNNIGLSSYLDVKLKNMWNSGIGIGYEDKTISYSALRGGPSIKIPRSLSGNFWIETNKTRLIILSFNTSYFESQLGNDNSYSASVSINPKNSFLFNVEIQKNSSKNILQYVNNIFWHENISYINATLKRETISAQIKLHYSFSPNLSFQWFSRLHFSKGNYYDFKKITSPRNDNFYDRFHAFTSNEINYLEESNEYFIDENSDEINDYSFQNPDFNFIDLQSNFVIRWEYKTGSTFFIVWNHGRNSISDNCTPSIYNNTKELIDIYPNNTFMLKLTYKFY